MRSVASTGTHRNRHEEVPAAKVVTAVEASESPLPPEVQEALGELSARLGHGNPAITASVYSHEFEVAARRSAPRALTRSMAAPWQQPAAAKRNRAARPRARK